MCSLYPSVSLRCFSLGQPVRFTDSLSSEVAAEKFSGGYIYSRYPVSCVSGLRM